MDDYKTIMNVDRRKDLKVLDEHTLNEVIKHLEFLEWETIPVCKLGITHALREFRIIKNILNSNSNQRKLADDILREFDKNKSTRFPFDNLVFIEGSKIEELKAKYIKKG